MRNHSTAIEYDQPLCLPPEAYMRITQKCGNTKQPKFRSSVYPSKPVSVPVNKPQKLKKKS